MVEAGVVAAILIVVALVHNRPIEWIGSVAVLASFLHGQVADRMAAKEAARPIPGTDCHRWSLRYYVGKEVLWFAYFGLIGAWSALIGVVVFLAYPVWRGWWVGRRARKVSHE